MALGEHENGYARSEQEFTPPNMVSVILIWQGGVLIVKVVFESTSSSLTPATSPHPGNLALKFVMWEIVFVLYSELKNIPTFKIPVNSSECLHLGKKQEEAFWLLLKTISTFSILDVPCKEFHQFNENDTF